MENKKVILYISMSLDGYLATKDDDISWLDNSVSEPEQYDLDSVVPEPQTYEEFTAQIDTYIVGRKTYEVIMGLTNNVFPHEGKFDSYILTRRPHPDENGAQFYTGDVEELINDLKAKGGKHIYCDGGGQAVKMLIDKGLIDEFYVTVIPIILGDGKPLFPPGMRRTALKAMPPRYNKKGYVELHYLRK